METEKFQAFSKNLVTFSPRTLELIHAFKQGVSRILVGNDIGRWACTVFLFVYFLLLFFPTVLPCVLLFYLVRQCLTGYKALFRRDLGNFLTGIGSILGSDDPYSAPRANIGGYFILKGSLEREQVLRLFENKFAEFSSQGLYKELRQKLTTWFGFSIWQDEEDFSLERHIHDMSSSFIKSRQNGHAVVVEENDVLNALYKFTVIPYVEGISPWDIHICRGLNIKGCTTKSSTVVLVRFHHALGDGFSMMKFMSELILDEKTRERSKQVFIQNIARAKAELGKKGSVSKIQVALDTLAAPIVAIFELAKHQVFNWDIDFFQDPKAGMEQGYIYVTTDVSTERIKKIKNEHGVTFTSVTFTAVTRAFTRFINQNYPGVALPPAIHTVVSVPFPSLELKMANDVTNSFITLPVGSTSDPGTIMREITQEQNSLKKSNVFLARLAFAGLVGQMPKALLKIIGLPALGVTTNFPGYEEQIEFVGKPVEKLAFIAAIPYDIGFYLWVLTYDKTTKICVGFRPDVVQNSTRKAEAFAEYLQEEFKNMSCCDGGSPEEKRVYGHVNIGNGRKL